MSNKLPYLRTHTQKCCVFQIPRLSLASRGKKKKICANFMHFKHTCHVAQKKKKRERENRKLVGM